MEKMKQMASVVMHIRFLDNEKPRTFYSRDVERKPGNVWYWMEHFKYLAEKKWEGKVKEFVIYRCVNGMRDGDPLIKRQYAHPSWQEPRA